MRARLLDMGEVGALRCESLGRALLAAARPADRPVVLLMRPLAAYLAAAAASAGEEAPGAGRELPRLPRADDGPPWLIDESQLLFQVVLPAERTRQLGLPRAAGERLAALAAPVVGALRALGLEAALETDGEVRLGGRTLATVALAESEAARGLRGRLLFDVDAERLAGLLPGADPDRFTGVCRELDPPPLLGDLAEALLAALEDAFGLEPVPSMPTPGELETIYDWDGRLRQAAGSEQRAPGAARALAGGDHHG